MELIRKQTVLNMLDDMQFERYHTHAELDLFKQIYDAIYKLQPVDAVEVVRCEYCKYYVGKMSFGREVFWCNRKYKQWSGMMELTDADDFCSHGERKTDETD